MNTKYLVVLGSDECFWSDDEYCCATAFSFDEFVMSYHVREFCQIEMTPEMVKDGIRLLEDGHFWQGSPVDQETLEDLHTILNEVIFDEQ